MQNQFFQLSFLILWHKDLIFSVLISLLFCNNTGQKWANIKTKTEERIKHTAICQRRNQQQFSKTNNRFGTRPTSSSSSSLFAVCKRYTNQFMRLASMGKFNCYKWLWSGSYHFHRPSLSSAVPSSTLLSPTNIVTQFRMRCRIDIFSFFCSVCVSRFSIFNFHYYLCQHFQINNFFKAII